MKVLVSGAKGQLGYDIVKRLNELGEEVCGVDIDDFDLTDKSATEKYVLDFMPDVVVHCAAYTAVDLAESNREACLKINRDGTRNLAEAAKKAGAKLMYFSTDYVFDGQGERFFEPEDEKHPINYYGETKLLGEEEVTSLLERYFILRISWVFGINGKNFVKTMQKLGRERDEVSVVCDQVGSPTYTADLARLVCEMIKTERYGTYHATNEGICSWAEFAEEVMKQSGLGCRVKKITSDMYPAAAKRPANSRLSKKKLKENGFELLPDWRDALKRFVLEENGEL